MSLDVTIPHVVVTFPAVHLCEDAYKHREEANGDGDEQPELSSRVVDRQRSRRGGEAR